MRELRVTEPYPGRSIERPRYPDTAAILDEPRCTVIAVDGFGVEERDAARAVARTDPRLAEALREPHFNVTEALAGVPTTMSRYAEASADVKALVHCLVDAVRLGVRSPLPEEALSAMGGLYVREVRLDDAWFAPALADAADSVVVPVPSADRRSVIGYAVADYLAQSLARARRRDPIPAELWGLLAESVEDTSDLARLADNAAARRIHRVAIPLLRWLVDAGADQLSNRLVNVLSQWGDLDRLVEWGKSGYRPAAQAFARIAARGALDIELEPYSDYSPGNTTSIILHEPSFADLPSVAGRWRLSDLLDERDLVEALECRVAAGDRYAAVVLARRALIAGRAVDAKAALAPGVREHDPDSVRLLVSIHHAHGDYRAAKRILRPEVRNGHRWAENMMRAVMLDAGDKRGLERDAARGDIRARRALIRLLADAGDLDALADRARAGDEFAAALRDRLLFKRGDADGLRESATRPDGRYAAWLLSELFAARADFDRLDALAYEGDVFAAQARARLLFDRGDRARLESLSSSGDKYATVALIRSVSAGKSVATVKAMTKAVPALAEQFPRWLDNTRSVEVIAFKADRHEMWTNPNAKAVLLTRALVEPRADPTVLRRVLVEEQDVVTLTRLTELGRSWAAVPLARLLLHAGKDEEAVRVLSIATDDGDTAAAAALADELSRQGERDCLHARAALGDRNAAEGLASALLADDRLDELLIRAEAGDGFALDRVVDHPVVTGDPDTARRLLQPWAEAGNPDAALALCRILDEAGQPDAAEVLTPFADSGLPVITARLVSLAYESRNVQRLRGYADSGNRHAAQRLALILYKQEDRDALHREVCANNTDHAAQFLLRLYRDANDDAGRPMLSLTPDGRPDPDDWAA